jgi:hypothetical protein
MTGIVDLQRMTAASTFMWVFRRDRDLLEISHDGSNEPTTLLVSRSTGEQQTFRFDDHAALLTFQASFTDHLLHAGWRFVEFRPERRSGPDRRQGPRDTPTRRRFTTVLPFRPRQDG